MSSVLYRLLSATRCILSTIFTMDLLLLKNTSLGSRKERKKALLGGGGERHCRPLSISSKTAVCLGTWKKGIFQPLYQSEEMENGVVEEETVEPKERIQLEWVWPEEKGTVPKGKGAHKNL